MRWPVFLISICLLAVQVWLVYKSVTTAPSIYIASAALWAVGVATLLILTRGNKVTEKIMEHVRTQMDAGITEGIVYISARSVDDNVPSLVARLQRTSDIHFAIDKRITECDGARSYAVSWSVDQRTPELDTKPHLLAGGKQGELIRRLLDMLQWFEAEGHISDDWSDDIAESTI